MIYTEMTIKAMKIAYEAYSGQLDHNDVPYIFHPYHLAEQMDDECSTCVALLHDTVEDTDITFETLSDLGFSKEDRYKNVNRIAQMAKLLSNQGFTVIVTCISKDALQRAEIKEFLGDKYVEIFVNRSIENCQKQDKKGLYKSIGLKNIVNDYQEGKSVTIEIDTNVDSEEVSKLKLLSELRKMNYLE